MTSSTTGRSSLGFGAEPLDHQVRQDDPRHVGMFGLRPAHDLGRRSPEVLERRLDLAQITGIPWPWRKASEVVSGMASLPGSWIQSRRHFTPSALSNSSASIGPQLPAA